MNDHINWDRKLAGDEIAGGLLAIVLIFVPPFLLVLLPHVAWIDKLFGHGRVLLFWALTFGLIWVFREKFNSIMQACFGSRGQSGE